MCPQVYISTLINIATALLLACTSGSLILYRLWILHLYYHDRTYPLRASSHEQRIAMRNSAILQKKIDEMLTG